MCIFSQTLVRGSRSTLQSPQAVYRTTSVEARGIRKARREDRHMAPNGSRERSCDTRRQRTVRACAHVHGGPAKAAHQKPRPCQTTVDSGSSAIKDLAPLKNGTLTKRGEGDLGPDTPAGQKMSLSTVSKAVLKILNAQGPRIRAHLRP